MTIRAGVLPQKLGYRIPDPLPAWSLDGAAGPNKLCVHNLIRASAISRARDEDRRPSAVPR